MLEQHIKEMLEKENLPENITKLQGDIKAMLRKSRGAMGKYHDKWKKNVRAYRGIMAEDETDYQAKDANEPARAVVPLSFAQVQTFASFSFLLLTQNARFYEMQPTGEEDVPLQELIEKGLSRDLAHNQWNAKLYQWLIDLARFSIAPIKHYWAIDMQSVNVQLPNAIQSTMLGPMMQQPPLATKQDFVKFEGNRIKNILPFKFLPDLRKPLTEWKDGQFVADEDEWHITNVKALEKQGFAAGVQFVRPMTRDKWESRNKGYLPQIEDLFGSSSENSDASDFMVCYTEGNIRLVPQKYSVGPEDEPMLYTFRMANDRLVGLEPSGHLHDEFNYDVGQFSPDHEAKLNEGLSDVIDALQECISWLYNSRILSVRQSLDRHMVVNPQFIDTSSLESRSPIIYTKKNAPIQDLRQAVMQLNITDTTSSHFQDADFLRNTLQFVTGVNENAMGQFSGGRRSATENRAANAGAASRMKMILSVNWASCLGPMGRKLMLNQRQGMSRETFDKVFGRAPAVAELFPLYCPSNPGELIGSEDFLVFDSTLTSEKGFLAQSLQELVTTVISNPEFAMASGFQLQTAVEDIQTLRGLTNVSRYFKPPQPIGNVPPPGAQVGPGEVSPIQPVPAIQQ